MSLTERAIRLLADRYDRPEPLPPVHWWSYAQRWERLAARLAQQPGYASLRQS